MSSGAGGPRDDAASAGAGEGGLGRRFLRATRTAPVITLGLDGRPHVPDDPMSGMVGGSEEETVEAANIVDEARRRSDDLVHRAAREADSIRDHAQRMGYEAGYTAGAQAARAELAQSLALVQAFASEGAAIRADLLRRSEREMVEMVIAALRAILGDRAVSDSTVVVHTVRHALERAGAQNVVRVRVHPSQAELVLAEMADADGEPPSFEVFADGSVGVGGCVVDTQHGRVDARLDVQLDAVARMLRDALPVDLDTLQRETLQREAADAA
ncbi:MAG: FliH/SctL family protein [Dehalococcoidia bacterium]